MSTEKEIFQLYRPEIRPLANTKEGDKVWEKINVNPLTVRDVAPLHVAITGAAGQIGYALSFLVARGQMLGIYQPVFLHLLELPQSLESLKGVIMELQDCAYPLLAGAIATSDLKEAFDGVDVAILVGSFPRKAGMERRDLISKNAQIFKDQGKAINDFAKPHVKVLVIGNPANTNALILSKCAPNLPRKNITSLTRLDHNRAKAQIALHLGLPTACIHNVVIWGNHSASQIPDCRFVYAEDYPEKGIVMPLATCMPDIQWTKDSFVPLVQNRGAQVIAARNLSAAGSAAQAACDHISNWLMGTPSGEVVSMGVITTGEFYGLQKDLVFSLPVTCRNGDYHVLPSLPLDESIKAMIAHSEKELGEEKVDAFNFLGIPLN